MKKVVLTGLMSVAMALVMVACGNNKSGETTEAQAQDTTVKKECCERPACECACAAEGKSCECCPKKEEKCADTANCFAHKVCANGEKPCCKEGAQEGEKSCCKKEGESCPKEK